MASFSTSGLITGALEQGGRAAYGLAERVLDDQRFMAALTEKAKLEREAADEQFRKDIERLNTEYGLREQGRQAGQTARREEATTAYGRRGTEATTAHGRRMEELKETSRLRREERVPKEHIGEGGQLYRETPEGQYEGVTIAGTETPQGPPQPEARSGGPGGRGGPVPRTPARPAEPFVPQDRASRGRAPAEVQLFEFLQQKFPGREENEIWRMVRESRTSREKFVQDFIVAMREQAFGEEEIKAEVKKILALLDEVAGRQAPLDTGKGASPATGGDTGDGQMSLDRLRQNPRLKEYFPQGGGS